MATTRKIIVSKLDRIFSKYIRLRDGHCVTCFSRENLQCGHLFTRQAYSTRWHESNAFCQCAKCNIRHEFDPQPLTSWFIKRYGLEVYDELHAVHKRPTKFSDSQLEVLVEQYKEKVKRLKNG